MPRVKGVDGATVQLRDDQGHVLAGGVFSASGSSGATAAVPTLTPGNYHASGIGIPCGPSIDFGSFLINGL